MENAQTLNCRKYCNWQCSVYIFKCIYNKTKGKWGNKVNKNVSDNSASLKKIHYITCGLLSLWLLYEVCQCYPYLYYCNLDYCNILYLTILSLFSGAENVSLWAENLRYLSLMGRISFLWIPDCSHLRYLSYNRTLNGILQKLHMESCELTELAIKKTLKIMKHELMILVNPSWQLSSTQPLSHSITQC